MVNTREENLDCVSHKLTLGEKAIFTDTTETLSQIVFRAAEVQAQPFLSKALDVFWAEPAS